MIDDELFVKSQEKRRLSINMKRAHKKLHNRSGGSGDNHVQRIDSKVLKMLQRTDPSLESVRKEAYVVVEHDSTSVIVYCTDIGCHLVEMVKTWL